MDFNSLDEIINYFKLDVKDSSEVKTELKNLIKKTHPDTNKGDFRTDSDKKNYHEVQSALDYLKDNTSNTSLSMKTELTELTKVITDLSKNMKNDVITENIEKQSINLSTKIQDSITSYHKLNSSPKVTGIIATTIITALWAFPSVVKDHPLLNFLYQHNKEFTVIWLLSLFVMGNLWIKIKSAEKFDAEIKRSYKLELTQNHIFSLFTKWMSATHRNLSIREDKKIITFTEDDLINFLITRYRIIEIALSMEETLHDFQVEKRIKEIEESSIFKNKIQPRNRLFLAYFTNIFPKPGKIDLELAQLICDLIIERLNSKGVITKSIKKSLSDTYVYEDNFI